MTVAMWDYKTRWAGAGTHSVAAVGASREFAVGLDASVLTEGVVGSRGGRKQSYLAQGRGPAMM